MSETLLSVQGQLVGIPVEEYTGVSGIIVDPVNKTIRPDETVLFEGPVNKATESTISLNETIANFEYIDIYFTKSSSSVNRAPMHSRYIVNSSSIQLNNCYWIADDGTTDVLIYYFKATASGTVIAFDQVFRKKFSTTITTNEASNIDIYKVVGVNRIVNN